MNIESLQATLRDFAAARDWQPFHTPKNLAAALTVEAAELMEIFQWMTPEESIAAHTREELKRRIGEEIADVLLYLVQLADHAQIDIPEAVRNKLVRNSLKYPPTRPPAHQPTPEATPAAQPVTHVLLDYENVQPSEEELRTLVPEATKVWVFHGPHQKQVESRFASFGLDMTAVPIIKTGKNALDFHLSFYMGHIVSGNSQAKIVVVANDKGYEPMLEHVTAMGFSVRKVGHGPAAAKQVPSSPVKVAATVPKPPARKVAAKKPTAKKAAAAKTAAAGKPVAAKKAVAKKAPAKKITPPLKKKVQKVVAPAAAPAGRQRQAGQRGLRRFAGRDATDHRELAQDEQASHEVGIPAQSAQATARTDGIR